MKTIEDGLYVQGGIAGGPLAEAALHRWAETGRRLDRLQEEADTLNDKELRDGVHRALRHFMQRQPRMNQVAAIARQIRSGTRCAWLVPGRLPSA
ncbi:hypothetical protein ACLMNJ_31025 [Streptomyces seoulensis]